MNTLRRILLGLAIFALAVGPSRAQTIFTQNQYTLPSTGTGLWQGFTVGTSHAQVLAASSARLYVLAHNPSSPGGNIVSCKWGGTAVAHAAGTFTLAPGQYLTFENSYVEQLALDCISDGASTPLTIGLQ